MKKIELKTLVKEIIQEEINKKQSIKEENFESSKNISVSQLKVGEKYVWFMGAAPLICVYKGKGTRPLTYKFQLDGSEHVLSYRDVIYYIKPLSYLDES